MMQSNQLDHDSTRFVMPLCRLAQVPCGLPKRLAQTIRIGGETLQFAAHVRALRPNRILTKPTGSLRNQADVLRDALDAVVCGV